MTVGAWRIVHEPSETVLIQILLGQQCAAARVDLKRSLIVKLLSWKWRLDIYQKTMLISRVKMHDEG